MSDEQSSEANLKVATDSIFAEANMSSNMGGQSNVDSDPVAKMVIEPTKVDSIKKQITLVQNQAPIDVTSGQWFDLPILFRTASTNPAGFTEDSFIGSVPLNYLLGLTDELLANEADSRKLVSSDRALQAFYNFKLDNVLQHFKNFNVFIERGEGGGIQVQDPFIFQLRRVYYSNWSSTATTILNTVAFSLSELNNSITSNYTFTNLGWIPGTALATTGGLYRNIQTLIGDQALRTQYGLYPESVPYRWQMRLANFGTFTNITVYLSYISEINANWTAQSTSMLTNVILPEPTFTTSVEKDDNKKRKLID